MAFAVPAFTWPLHFVKKEKLSSILYIYWIIQFPVIPAVIL